MDAFENLVASLLEREGYWVRARFKVNLTREEKRKIGRSSSPRWELDIVAYKGDTNEVRVVECKSYLDSRGVTFRDLAFPDSERPNLYKLFNDDALRAVVFDRLMSQLVEAGSCKPDPTVRLCLAAGTIATETDREQLSQHFDRKGWILLDRRWLVDALKTAADGGFEDDVASVVAKLILRPAAERHRRSAVARERVRLLK